MDRPRIKVKVGQQVRVDWAERAHGVVGGWRWHQLPGRVVQVNRVTADVRLKSHYPDHTFVERVRLERIHPVEQLEV